MKNLIYILYLTIIALLLASCKKDDLPNKSINSDYYLIVDIDNKTTSFNNSVQVDKDQTDFFTIRGFGDNGRMVLELDSLPIPTTGMFTADVSADLLYADQTDKIWFALWFPSNTITILENNSTYVKGTFSFTGVATDNSVRFFTKGSFKAKKM